MTNAGTGRYKQPRGRRSKPSEISMRTFLLTLAALAAIMPAHAEENAAAYLVSYIEVVPAQKNQATSLLRELAAASLRDAGVVRFEVLQRTAPSYHFLVLEVWKDQQSHDGHAAVTHTKQFQDKLKGLLMAPVDDRPSIATFVAPLPGPIPRGAAYVVTHVDVPPPVRDKITGPLQTLAETSRKEKGNLRFDVLQQKSRPNHFTVVETWANRSIADAHELTAHTREFRATLVPLTGALYDQRWYQPL
jgi:quinol monooxygenase YgiN